MNPEAAFLRAIAERPDEDLPHLLYADWLEEQGGADEQARAEFIRVQCALENREPGCELDSSLLHRERELFHQCWPTLLEPVKRAFGIDESLFHVENPSAGSFLRDWFGLTTAKHLIEEHLHRPQTRVLLRTEGTDDERRYLHGIAEIEFRRGRIDDLWICPDQAPDPKAWQRFQSLYDLPGLTLDEGDWLEVWAELPILPRLRRLGFGGGVSPVPGEAVMRLFDFTEPLMLESLELNAVQFERETLQQFLESWLLRQLHTLKWTAQDPDEIRVFAHRQALTRLRKLNLHGSACHSLGACELADSRAFDYLEVLDLTHCSIGDTGLRALARRSHFPQLTQLHLQDNRVGEYSIKCLAASESFRSLKLLNLLGNPNVNEACLTALSESQSLSALETVLIDERLKVTPAADGLRARFKARAIFR